MSAADSATTSTSGHVADRVLLTVDQGVATLTLNRPQALNALDAGMAEAIAAVGARCEHDDAIRCVVIRASGDHFMAGGDIRTFHALLDGAHDDGALAERRVLFERMIQQVHVGIVQFRRMRKPVVAAVQGACAGFGVSLMLAADLVIAADDAYFTLAYVNIGVTPDGGSTFHLPRVVGTRKAMEIALLGDRFGALEAERLNLVNRVVSRSELGATVDTLARRLAAGPTLAIARTKGLIAASLDTTLDAQLQREAEAFAASAVTADFREGVAAFLSKRAADFHGR